MKKMIAPIIVTIVVLAFLLLYTAAFVLTAVQDGAPASCIFMIAFVVFLVIVMLTMIYVLMQRIKEIKEENEDDINKY